MSLKPYMSPAEALQAAQRAGFQRADIKVVRTSGGLFVPTDAVPMSVRGDTLGENDQLTVEEAVEDLQEAEGVQ